MSPQQEAQWPELRRPRHDPVPAREDTRDLLFRVRRERHRQVQRLTVAVLFIALVLLVLLFSRG